MMENRASESRERRIRVPIGGDGITSLGGHAQGFRRVLYEGGGGSPTRERISIGMSVYRV